MGRLSVMVSSNSANLSAMRRRTVPSGEPLVTQAALCGPRNMRCAQRSQDPARSCLALMLRRYSLRTGLTDCRGPLEGLFVSPGGSHGSTGGTARDRPSADAGVFRLGPSGRVRAHRRSTKSCCITPVCWRTTLRSRHRPASNGQLPRISARSSTILCRTPPCCATA